MNIKEAFKDIFKIIWLALIVPIIIILGAFMIVLYTGAGMADSLFNVIFFFFYGEWEETYFLIRVAKKLIIKVNSLIRPYIPFIKEKKLSLG